MPQMERFAEMELNYYKARKDILNIKDVEAIHTFLSHPLAKRSKSKIQKITGIVKECPEEEQDIELFQLLLKNNYENLFEWKEGFFCIFLGIKNSTFKRLDIMVKILDNFAFTVEDWWNIIYYYMDYENIIYFPAISNYCKAKIEEEIKKGGTLPKDPELALFLKK
jgi:hypothetical protein